MKHVLPRELLREIVMNLPADRCAELHSMPINNVFNSYVNCLHLHQKMLFQQYLTELRSRITERHARVIVLQDGITDRQAL